MNAATYTKAGAKAASPAKLDKKIFGVEVTDHSLLKQAYLAELAGRRANFAKAKKRGEVRGGGQKPWRQKGTGRARFGSSRNPIWRGGGAAFGPTGEENYQISLNTRSRRLALRQALSMAASEDRIKVIEAFSAAHGKVKQVLATLKKLNAEGRVLLIAGEKDEMFNRATRNLPNVKVSAAGYLSAQPVIDADVVIIDKKALEVIHQRLGESPAKVSNMLQEGKK